MTEVIVTGTGVPHAAVGRAGAGVAVRHGDLTLQFDAGRATTMRLFEAGVKCGSLDALFVTHHHSDHLTGLQDVLFTRWVENMVDHTALPVVAPVGATTRYLELMMVPWADDIEIRQSHTGRTDRPDPEIIGFEPPLVATEVWRSGEVVVTAVAVHHEPVSPAVAYRVDTADGAVVISGDTRVCDEVADLAAGADVVVHEVFQVEKMRPFMAAMPHLEHIADYHADDRELAAMAERVGIPTLVLTHMIPAPSDEAGERELAADMAAAGYSGNVIVARDLTSVTF